MKIVMWICMGYYFDFDDMEFYEVEDEELYFVRLFFWYYDFDWVVMNVLKCCDVRRKIVIKKK